MLPTLRVTLLEFRRRFSVRERESLGYDVDCPIARSSIVLKTAKHLWGNRNCKRLVGQIKESAGGEILTTL